MFIYRSLVFVLLLCFSIQPASAQFNARVDVTQSPSTWTYTLINNEAANSPNFIGGFTLSVDAPITSIGAPDGWNYQSDNLSYVYWFNTDTALPYLHDVAPGSSLGGFTIQSEINTSYSLSETLDAWDHTQDALGPSVAGNVIAPSSQPSPVPEVSTAVPFGMGVLLILLIGVRGGRPKISC